MTKTKNDDLHPVPRGHVRFEVTERRDGEPVLPEDAGAWTTAHHDDDRWVIDYVPAPKA